MNSQYSPEMVEAAKVELARRRQEKGNKISELLKSDVGNPVLSFLRDVVPSPSMPIGIDIASGLISHAGSNPEESEMIKNLPHILSGEKPGMISQLAQGIGEYLPETLATRGAPALGRIIGSGAYAGATDPNNPLSVVKGLGFGALGEAIPGALKGIGHAAEKIYPIKYVQQKASEMINKFENAVERQKDAYMMPMKRYGEDLVTSTPKKYVGLSKEQTKGLAPDSKDAYQEFLEEPNFQNLHELQSKAYKDAMGLAGNPASYTDYKKALKIYNSLKDKALGFLRTREDPKALADYRLGASITRNEVKPMQAGGAGLNKILDRRNVDQIEPNELYSYIKKALESKTARFPETHFLRDIHHDLKSKLGATELMKDIIPEQPRKWLPNFAAIAQYPNLEEFLKVMNASIHDPLRKGLLGTILTPSPD